MIKKLSEEEMKEVLERNVLGRIGCADADRIYIVPVNYVFDGRHIICHSVMGKKIRMMREKPNVCFEVEEIKDFNHWSTIVISGKYEELQDSKQKYEAMKLFVDRTLKLKISETAIPPEISEQRLHPRSPGNIMPVIYRIRILEMTGRSESS